MTTPIETDPIQTKNTDEDQLRRHQAVKADAVGLIEYLLQVNIDLVRALEEVPEEHRPAIAKLQLVAVQYGRMLEREDWFRQMEKAAHQSAGGIKSSIEISTKPEFKPSDILVAPGWFKHR